MSHHDKQQAAEDRAAWDVAEDLEYLRALLQCRKDGYKVYAAVDTAEIYSHAFPLTGATRRWEGSLRSHLDSVMKLQIALAWLFDERDPSVDVFVGPLVLLPPYEVELQDVLSAIITDLARLVEGRTHIYTDLLSRLMERLGGASAIQAEWERVCSNNPISDEFRDNLAAAWEESKTVVPLLGFLSGDAATGVGRIVAMVRNKRLVELTSITASMEALPRDATAKAHAWMQEIEKVRQEPSRHHATALDGQALAYVEYLNGVLSAQRRSLILLTHSRSVCSAAASLKGTDGPLTGLPLVCSPQWITAYLAFTKGDPREIMPELTEAFDVVEVLRRAIQKRDPQRREDGSPAIASVDARVRAFLAKSDGQVAGLLRTVRNLYLASASAQYIGSFTSRLRTDIDAQHQLLEKLHDLSTHRKAVSEFLRSAEKNLNQLRTTGSQALGLTGLRRVRWELPAPLPDTRVEYVGTQQVEQALNKLVLGGEIVHLPLTIQFRQAAMQDLAKKCADALADGKYILAYRQLVEGLVRGEWTSESSLLVGFLLAEAGDLRGAVEETQRGIALEIGPLHELHFLQALARHRLKEYRQARDVIKEAIAAKKAWMSLAPSGSGTSVEYPGDPRYHNLHARVLLRLALASVPTADQEGLLDEGFKEIKTAKALVTADTPLALNIANLEAYYRCEAYRVKDDPAQLENAKQASEDMLRLRRETPRPGWQPMYTDTILWVRFWQEMARIDVRCRRLKAFLHSVDVVLRKVPDAHPFADDIRGHKRIIESAVERYCSPSPDAAHGVL